MKTLAGRMPPRCSQYCGARARMPFSSRAAMTTTGRSSVTVAHGSPSAMAARICSNCQAIDRTRRSDASEKTVKFSPFTSRQVWAWAADGTPHHSAARVIHSVSRTARTHASAV
jgi:hypothetical protein